MNKNDIERIEKGLEITLPDYYKQQILHHPLTNKTKYKKVWKNFFNDADELIKLNMKLREKGVKGKKWPHKLFLIGMIDSLNNFYFINLSNQNDECIYYLGISDKSFNPKKIDNYIVFENIKEFIDDCIFAQDLADNP